MPADRLVDDLVAALAAVPIFDPHSHIDPHAAAARSLDDILGYHYYTELAHSAGLPQLAVAAGVEPRERVRAIVAAMPRFANTAQAAWFLDIARRYLHFPGTVVTPADADTLFDTALAAFTQPDWEERVWAETKLEAVFLTNEFDDPLSGFDTAKYVPCLRTDGLVFQLTDPAVRARLARATGVEVGDANSLVAALGKLFAHFKGSGAKACAISLPPDFTPEPVGDAAFDAALAAGDTPTVARGVFWRLAEQCRDHQLPFDLMVGVNRRVYEAGVYQGQDLFDQRSSLIQYRKLFNAFPDVKFPVSVLTSSQNQELVAYAWLFPNVYPHGHWWYSNIPAYIERDLTERIQAVPLTKLIGYYSDAYKLEFIAPKFAMYRGVLAGVLADNFVRPGKLSETAAVELGTRLLRGSAREVFLGESR